MVYAKIFMCNEHTCRSNAMHGTQLSLAEMLCRGVKATMQVLLRGGADVFAKDQAGQTPRELAAAECNHKVEELLTHAAEELMSQHAESSPSIMLSAENALLDRWESEIAGMSKAQLAIFQVSIRKKGSLCIFAYSKRTRMSQQLRSIGCIMSMKSLADSCYVQDAVPEKDPMAIAHTAQSQCWVF